MTNEEAIKRLKSDIYKYSDFTENPNENEFWTAFDMAIKALEQEPKTDIWSIKDVANTFKKHGLIREQEPCEDAISRQEVLDEINRIGIKAFETYNDYSQFFDFVDNLPPVTPQPKIGHWIKSQDSYGNNHFTCPFCEHDIATKYAGTWEDNYCSNCGARLESEVHDADSD